jgi:hypothetical protein
MAKTLQPDATRTYRILEPCSFGDRIVNPGQRLDGSDPVVRDHFELFVPSDAPDSEVAARLDARRSAAEAEAVESRHVHDPAGEPPAPVKRLVMVGPDFYVDARNAGIERVTTGQIMAANDPRVEGHEDSFEPFEQVFPKAAA